MPIAANTIVNKSFLEGNCLIAGAPAVKKKDEVTWYIRDGESDSQKVALIEQLKSKMHIFG